MRLYVGNLGSTVSDDDLQQVFVPFGQVASARVVTDRDGGQSKGFGFVDMPSTDEAQAAITALNGKEMDGRALTVNEARPRPERTEGGHSQDRRR
jgi:cold-inducible RNA-binding protein